VNPPPERKESHFPGVSRYERGFPVMAGPVLAGLYVPGDRPERFAKAAASGADVVIIDLEDAVAPARKADARSNAVAWLEAGPVVPTEVRVNGEPDLRAVDLAALRGVPGLHSVRLPKVESAADVRDAVAALGPGVGVTCLLETALGVEAAYEIATADPAVAAIGLGEADLRSDLRISGEAGLTWARSRIVVAARAAGLPAPMMSAYTDVADLDGLAVSCAAGRALGFVGRSAIHPRQVPVIVEAFLPGGEAVARAAEVIAALESAAASGTGVVTLPDGRMVDRAMEAGARATLALAARRPAIGRTADGGTARSAAMDRDEMIDAVLAEHRSPQRRPG
jgi:citrate lyase subunit beta / citryl-CoA lyase